MTDTKQKKQVEKNGLMPVVAAVAAAAVGVGVGVAGAVVMSDEKNRQKVKDGFSKVKNQVEENLGEMEKKAKNETTKVENKVKQVVQDAKKKDHMLDFDKV